MIMAFATLSITPASAQVTSSGGMPLPVDQAFKLSATRQNDGSVQIRWTIAPGYYLYHDKLSLVAAARIFRFPSFKGTARQDDPTFGPSTVFHDHVAAVVPLMRRHRIRSKSAIRMPGPGHLLSPDCAPCRCDDTVRTDPEEARPGDAGE